MYDLDHQDIQCPYCGETLQVLVNPEEIGHSYIEDCQICCAPIEFRVEEEAGELKLYVYSQDETY